VVVNLHHEHQQRPTKPGMKHGQLLPAGPNTRASALVSNRHCRLPRCQQPTLPPTQMREVHLEFRRRHLIGLHHYSHTTSDTTRTKSRYALLGRPSPARSASGCVD
jgi:hypothetical protein